VTSCDTYLTDSKLLSCIDHNLRTTIVIIYSFIIATDCYHMLQLLQHAVIVAHVMHVIIIIYYQRARP